MHSSGFVSYCTISTYHKNPLDYLESMSCTMLTARQTPSFGMLLVYNPQSRSVSQPKFRKPHYDFEIGCGVAVTSLTLTAQQCLLPQQPGVRLPASEITIILFFTFYSPSIHSPFVFHLFPFPPRLPEPCHFIQFVAHRHKMRSTTRLRRQSFLQVPPARREWECHSTPSFQRKMLFNSFIF